MTEGSGRRREEVRLVPREEWDLEKVAGPLVTVVIPCYNQAHFLSEAIESVLSQSYPNFEVVVVDDGSTDDTSEVAGRYLHVSRVHLISQKNQGLSGARNTGIGHARGEYLVFLDADDRLLPEALEAGVRELEAHPECAFVSGRCNNIGPDGSPLKDPPRLHVEGDHYLALLRRCYIWPPAVVMFRRWVFEAVGGFDTSLRSSEDYEMYLRVARRFPVCNHKGVLVLVRYYPQGLALLSERRMERHRLARRLRASKQELEAHEWQLKELEDTQASESALEEERQEVQVLRKRIRKLERRIQNLDRESQSGLVPRIRKLSNRGVSHLRSRVLGE